MARKIISVLAAAGAFTAAALGITTPIIANAHYVQAPCDFVTAGGFVFKDNGERANFGAHGGCKNGEFWGNVNYVDHENQFHLNATRITGYLVDPATPNSRDICGWARINDQSQEVMFRVRLVDNGEPGKDDDFGITIDNWYSSGNRFYHVSTRQLGDDNKGGGGNVQLHKSNKSNTIDPGYFSLQEWQMCGDMMHP
jgi:hypothetical protein